MAKRRCGSPGPMVPPSARQQLCVRSTRCQRRKRPRARRWRPHRPGLPSPPLHRRQQWRNQQSTMTNLLRQVFLPHQQWCPLPLPTCPPRLSSRRRHPHHLCPRHRRSRLHILLGYHLLLPHFSRHLPPHRQHPKHRPTPLCHRNSNRKPLNARKSTPSGRSRRWTTMISTLRGPS